MNAIQKMLGSAVNNNIEKTLTNYINILPKELASFIKENCFVAGGAIYSLDKKTKVNDIDLYFYNKDVIPQLDKLLTKLNISVKMETKWAITFLYSGTIYQFITKLPGKPSEVVSRFDFVHCMNYYEFNSNKVVFHKDYSKYDDSLKFNVNCLYPFRSLERVVKFLGRNFTIDSFELVKIALAINQQKINNHDDFNDQIEGLYVNKDELNKLQSLSRDLLNKKFNNKLEEILNDPLD